MAVSPTQSWCLLFTVSVLQYGYREAGGTSDGFWWIQVWTGPSASELCFFQNIRITFPSCHQGWKESTKIMYLSKSTATLKNFYSYKLVFPA